MIELATILAMKLVATYEAKEEIPATVEAHVVYVGAFAGLGLPFNSLKFHIIRFDILVFYVFDSVYYYSTLQ